VWDRDWQAEIRVLQERETRARQVLGVGDRANTEDIKRAWRRESFKHHPDRNGGSIESQRRFVLINCAYRCLTEGVACDELDSEKPLSEALTDGKYRLDNPWGYFVWWRENYFGD
jgi:preprotein translocase subunit Sec63